MNILDIEFFVEVQYDIFEILSPNIIYRSLPSWSSRGFWKVCSLKKQTLNEFALFSSTTLTNIFIYPS